jgi:hypothetical protein
MKQITQLIEVMLVGRGGDQAVGQATLGIDTNVGLHAKVPLIAFLGLMHLRIALLLFVLGRAGCSMMVASTSALVIMTPASRQRLMVLNN